MRYPMAEAHALGARVGERVRALRQNLGWRQIDLARKCVWSRASIANLEAGRQNIGLDQLEMLAHHLGVTPAELVSDSGGPAALVDHREILIAALQRAELAAVAGVKRSIAMQINGIRDAALARGYTSPAGPGQDRDGSVTPDAYRAARSARFEHGESGGML